MAGIANGMMNKFQIDWTITKAIIQVTIVTEVVVCSGHCKQSLLQSAVFVAISILVPKSQLWVVRVSADEAEIIVHKRSDGENVVGVHAGSHDF